MTRMKLRNKGQLFSKLTLWLAIVSYLFAFWFIIILIFVTIIFELFPIPKHVGVKLDSVFSILSLVDYITYRISFISALSSIVIGFYNILLNKSKDSRTLWGLFLSISFFLIYLTLKWAGTFFPD